MSTRDGGPAFPSVGEGFGNPRYSAEGMSLRDWFAGQALAGMWANHDYTDATIQSMAELAYGQADAMLTAREAKS